MANEPKSQGDAPFGGVDAVTLGRITDLENSNRHSKVLIDLVNDTNKFILVVLFVAFIALIVGVIIVCLNAIVTDTNSRQELSNQVQQLNYEVQHSTVVPKQ
jgi:uncharacterized membrane protein (DUF106 family)